MSTELVSVEERIKQRLANINKSTAAPASKMISTRGGQFTLPDGKSSAGPVNCIVLDYINRNSYYDTPWDPNNITPPVCTASGRDLLTMGPDDSVETPVNETCNGCPNNEFGSSGRGKACTNNIVLAILPEKFEDDSEVMTIKVSPTAIKDWSSYVRTLAEQGLDPVQVVTSISFKPGVNYPSLQFRHLGGNEQLDSIGRFLPEADLMLASS